MIEPENLKYLITEEIYILDEKINDYTNQNESVLTVEEPITKKQKTEAETLPLKDETAIESKPEQIDELVILVLPMNSQDKELLNNLLKAIKKTESDIKLINTFSEFKNNFKTLVSFGYLNELKHQLDESLTTYKTATLDDKRILISSPLSTLHNNNLEKGTLWKCLQEVFLK